jgi:hypothetical protein
LGQKLDKACGKPDFGIVGKWRFVYLSRSGAEANAAIILPQPAILTTSWSGFQLGAEIVQGVRQARFRNRWKMAVCVFEPGKPRGERGNNPAPTCNLDHRVVRISTWGRNLTRLAASRILESLENGGLCI